MNSPRLTDFGSYEYSPISLSEARQMIAGGFQSVIGHEATAAILSDLLGVSVSKSRDDYRQMPGDEVIVFQINSRLQEGQILDRDQIEDIGYQFGLLRRLA